MTDPADDTAVLRRAAELLSPHLSQLGGYELNAAIHGYQIARQHARILELEAAAAEVAPEPEAELTAAE